MKRGLDSELDQWRETLANLPSMLQVISDRFIEVVEGTISQSYE